MAKRAAPWPYKRSTNKLARNGEFLRFAPGNDAENAGLHGEIENGDAEDRKKNASGNIFFRIANFSTQVANVVVAEIAINCADHSEHESSEPDGRKMESAGRKIEGELRVKMADATPDKPEHGAYNADPEQDGDFADRGDTAIEKDHQENREAAGDGLRLPPIEGINEFGIIGEADGGGGDGERRLNQGLPNEQERHEATPFLRTVGFAQEDICAACFGHGSASFAQTNPSRVARRAPASQAMRACGPPMALMTRELTTKGPMPTISIMLSATASFKPRPRSN